MNDAFQLQGRNILVMGVANRKSVAWQIAERLEAQGARVIYSVRSQERLEKVKKLLADREVFVCDVEQEEQINKLAEDVKAACGELHGLVHSIAFAEYDEQGIKPFHETTKKQFLRTIDISCHSLIAVANAFKDILTRDASVVTVSISTTRMASENYGFMAPVKAALDSSLAFLAKSFSRFSEVRFNAVSPSLLKTSASAGIPGYVDAYLYAEKVIPRKRAVETGEAANVAMFLLSPLSSGITAQSLIVDAGMSINYFDADLISGALKS